jgi:hypothetical protein
MPRVGREVCRVVFMVYYEEREILKVAIEKTTSKSMRRLLG